ncbi:hypothetical protein KM043_001261 [Ampulex compressa]|nr:hypothetical protein KM043_001261 [Ampulex compressa]
MRLQSSSPRDAGISVVSSLTTPERRGSFFHPSEILRDIEGTSFRETFALGKSITRGTFAFNRRPSTDEALPLPISESISRSTLVTPLDMDTEIDNQENSEVWRGYSSRMRRCRKIQQTIGAAEQLSSRVAEDSSYLDNHRLDTNLSKEARRIRQPYEGYTSLMCEMESCFSLRLAAPMAKTLDDDDDEEEEEEENSVEAFNSPPPSPSTFAVQKRAGKVLTTTPVPETNTSCESRLRNSNGGFGSSDWRR